MPQKARTPKGKYYLVTVKIKRRMYPASFYLLIAEQPPNVENTVLEEHISTYMHLHYPKREYAVIKIIYFNHADDYQSRIVYNKDDPGWSWKK